MLFLSKRQIVIHVLIYALGLAVLAKLLEPWLFFPVAVVVSLIHLGLASRFKRARYRSIVESARAAQIESLPSPSQIKSRDIDDLLINTLKDVTAELEEKYFQLVEKNIQLLSLKEISLTIISSVNEPRIVESVQSFLSKGLGFKEIFVGITVLIDSVLLNSVV